MAPKLYPSKAASLMKRKRRVISLEDKLKVIKQYEKGKAINVIARQLGWPHSTISTILKNREKIDKAVKEDIPMTSTIITKQREGPIADMEKLLLIWIEEQNKKSIGLNLMMITAKARALFRMLKAKAGPDCDVQFNATSGWFKRFKLRHSLHRVMVNKDTVDPDAKPDKAFAEEFDKLIGEEGYLSQQIFDMNEALLNLKKNPKRTFVQKEIVKKEFPKSEEQQAAANEKKDEGPQKVFTVNGLAVMFSSFNSALRQAEDMDPNVERFFLIESKIHDALTYYRQIYNEKKMEAKKISKDNIEKNPTPSTEATGDPQPGPSHAVSVVDEDSESTVECPENELMRVIKNSPPSV